MATLQESANKALAAHGIGSGAPPGKAELWEQLGGLPQTEAVKLTIENRFYGGFDHSELDWSRPVHAILADFKGDGMQMGMLSERLDRSGEQYVFVGNPLPFNGGWHFTAVNDFEHKAEQEGLDPAWKNIRVWHRVNLVPTLTESGEPALTPRDAYSPERKAEGAMPLSEKFRFASLYFVGGLMPHTLNATAIAGGAPAGRLVAKHVELGATLVAIGHGLDVLLACADAQSGGGDGAPSVVAGLEAAAFPRQERLLRISGVRPGGAGAVCRCAGPSGAVLVSAGYWGAATAEALFGAAGIGGGGAAGGSSRTHLVQTEEPVRRLDVARMPGMEGAVWRCGASAPCSAVFVDEAADPMEVFTILSHLMEAQMSFQLVSHSTSTGEQTRIVTTMTVFGDPTYGLRDCVLTLPTTPANCVPEGARFDSFFVAGGQCPYYMLGDHAITAIMDGAVIAAAVCHGPEALIGSKWMTEGRFTADAGCWMSFRDMPDRFEKRRPGETVRDGNLFSGSSPSATREVMQQACAAILELRASAGQLN